MQSRQRDRVHNKAQTCSAGPLVQPPALLLQLARFLIYIACAEVCPGKGSCGDEFIFQKTSKCTMGEAVLKSGRTHAVYVCSETFALSVLNVDHTRTPGRRLVPGPLKLWLAST
jgi:hypothetical protein